MSKEAQMSKYQFYCKPNSNRKEFTYLDMGTETFNNEKQQIMEMGFEVEDDVIHAESLEEAIKKFKSNFCAPLEGYANSNPAGGLATFVFESFKALLAKK